MLTLQILAEASDKAEVLLYDTISSYSESSAKRIVSELKKLKQKEIKLRINSRGGDVFEGLAIYSYLQSITDRKVITVIDGLAASMASVIALGGNEVHIASNGYLMIHNPNSVVAGDADYMRSIAEVMDQFAATMRDIYAEKTGLSVEKIKELMDAGTWINADEAIKQGFADKKIGKSANTFKIAASCELENIPENVLAALGYNQQPTDKKPKPQGGNVDELLKALGVKTEGEALAKIKALNAEVATLKTEKGELTAKLENSKTELDKLDAKVSDLKKLQNTQSVDMAIAQGKILPKDRDLAIEMVNQNPDIYAKWLETQKPIAKNLTAGLIVPDNNPDGNDDNPYTLD